ncbi:hypothetical protein BLA60_17945 [Actinophytocola xinjiangensis]|uniref:Glycosyl hydrolase family 43 n=1 Tax=Actinophytocola xinjiangensis TaxID=485602 RepID=A0A7Z0WL32_9PSEU|nr:hypothetical protein BLA60_17945 [Actinophytocola xinjiangensis]
MSRRILVGALVAGVVAAGVAVGAASASGGVTATANESTFPLADPDTLRAEDGRYVTYGTTVGAGRGKRCGGVGKLWVPVLTHGSGNTVGMSDCASGDALPGGPGEWASGNIWAPGVVRFGDRFFMYYTASRKGSGQKCLGRAISRSAYGPFRNAGGWACPPGGRWAIDANPFVAGGRMYVAYRDDAITSGPETGISVVRTDGEGRAEWSTRRDALKSTHLTWDTRRAAGTTHVIENPSMFKAGDHWFLAYSGNNWDSARYATGIAKCGTGPIPGTRCTPLRDGVARPYFGFTGEAGLGPYRGLPGNHRGPGGLDVFTAADGGKRVVYHWWNGTSRFPMTGAFGRDSGGFRVR